MPSVKKSIKKKKKVDIAGTLYAIDDQGCNEHRRCFLYLYVNEDKQTVLPYHMGFVLATQWEVSSGFLEHLLKFL